MRSISHLIGKRDIIGSRQLGVGNWGKQLSVPEIRGKTDSSHSECGSSLEASRQVGEAIAVLQISLIAPKISSSRLNYDEENALQERTTDEV